MRVFLLAILLTFGSSMAGAATLTVTELNLGSGGGLYPGGSSPTLAEASDALSTVGDSSFVALGTGGTLTFSLDMAVGDGIGNDITFFDPFGLHEGLSVSASSDGIAFLSIGSNVGSSSVSCSQSAPCATSFDLAGSGLASASFFKVVAIPLIVGSFPEAYDFDGIEVLNTAASVPLPAAGWLLIASIGGLAALKRRRRPSIT